VRQREHGQAAKVIKKEMRAMQQREQRMVAARFVARSDRSVYAVARI